MPPCWQSCHPPVRRRSKVDGGDLTHEHRRSTKHDLSCRCFRFSPRPREVSTLNTPGDPRTKVGPSRLLGTSQPEHAARIHTTRTQYTQLQSAQTPAHTIADESSVAAPARRVGSPEPHVPSAIGRVPAATGPASLSSVGCHVPQAEHTPLHPSQAPRRPRRVPAGAHIPQLGAGRTLAGRIAIEVASVL